MPNARFSLPVPPAHAWQLRSDDVDEVREVVSRMHGEHARIPHMRGRYGYELSVVGGERVSIGWCRVALAQTVRGGLREPCLHLPLDHAGHYRIGQREYMSVPGGAVFIAPQSDFSRRSAPGTMLAVQIDGSALGEELRARHAGTSGEVIDRATLLPLGAVGRNRLSVAIEELFAASAPDVRAERRAASEAHVVSLVAQLLGQTATAPSRTQKVAASRLANLEDWISAHLQEPITLGRLCAVAGVGERALQLAFRLRHGVSPMRFVTERRLAEVHRRLLAGAACDDVTRVALATGFTHLGRFSAVYREAFGEAPSHTLRRRRDAR